MGKSCWPGSQAALLPAMRLEKASLAIRGLRFLLRAIRGHQVAGGTGAQVEASCEHTHRVFLRPRTPGCPQL